MLRFAPPRHRLTQDAHWPEVQRPGRRTPFSRRPDLEVLSVVVDAELLDGLSDNDLPSRELLLAGLLSHEFVRTLRYSEAGPPPELARQANPLSSEAVSGWLVVGERDLGGMQHWPVVAADDDSVLEAAVVGDAPEVAERDFEDPAYAELDAREAGLRRRLDAIAAKAAAVVGADMFITHRPYLRTARWEVTDGVLIATPLQALPLVSLYLRAQDRFIGWRDSRGHGTTTMTRGTFYSRAAVELVPQGWTVLTALAEHAQSGGDRRPLELAQAVYGRLQQTLIARDTMYWALNRPQDNDAADEALSAFDLATLTLAGAIDASARIAHHLLSLTGGDQSVAWLNRAWRKRACAASNALDSVFSGTSHLHAVTILSELRNTIHATQLNPLAVAISRTQVTTVIELPANSVKQLLSAMRNLGGPSPWGVVKHVSGRHLADPALLLDTLIANITTMLDAVMHAMPVGDLPGVNPRNRAVPQRRLAMLGGVPSESVLWQLDL